MNEERLRKIAQEEIKKQIMENLDSSIIFTYINNLEENLKNNYISKDKIRAKIDEICENHKIYEEYFVVVKVIDILKELLEE